jgi:hypothetical protein
VVAEHFKHCFEVTFLPTILLPPQAPPVVRRFDLPGVHALIFVLEASLGQSQIQV